MATIIRSKNLAAAPRVYANPVQDGLLANHIFCTQTADLFARNFAPNQPDGAIYGSPSLSLGGTAARFKGLQDFLQTGVQEPRAGTVLCVISSTATMADNANSPMWYGTFVNTPLDEATASNTFGISARVTAAGAVRFGAGRGTSVADDHEGDTAIVQPDHTAPTLYTCTFPNTAATALTDHTNDNTSADADPGFDDPRFPTDAQVRVGSGYSTYEGICDVSVFRMWNRVLSTTEIDAEVADARRFMATLGVTV